MKYQTPMELALRGLKECDEIVIDMGGYYNPFRKATVIKVTKGRVHAKLLRGGQVYSFNITTGIEYGKANKSRLLRSEIAQTYVRDISNNSSILKSWADVDKITARLEATKQRKWNLREAAKVIGKLTDEQLEQVITWANENK